MRFKNLGRYKTGGTGSKMKLSISPPKTRAGRIYRFSPNEDAQPRHFLIGDVQAEIPLTDELRSRMKLTPRSKQTVCPYSGTVADDGAYTHPDDKDAVVAIASHAVVSDFEDEIARWAKDFNRRAGKSSFIKMEAKVRRTPRPKPRFSRRDLMRELVCDHCGRDYGVFAIGLFCPDCGAPNVRLHFARECELVGDQVTLADELDEELAYRLLGNAHEDVLTAFEATQKAVYLHGKHQATSERPKVGNDFQNVERATKRFAELDLNPFENLTETEMAGLLLNIQKRHIIGHNLGVVDDKFATHAADAKVGETVHLVGEDIRTFSAICQKVIDTLDGWLGGSPSPTIGDEPLLGSIKELPVSPDDPKGLMALDLDLSLLARKVALWTAEQCPDAMCNFVKREALHEAFSGCSESELKEAIAELQTDGFVQARPDYGTFRPRLDLYLTFDPIAHGTDLDADTIAVAELALEGPDVVNVRELFAKSGMERRRFNPVVEHVAAQVHDGGILRTNDREFAIRSFIMSPEDRVALKRFVARLKG